VKVPNCVESASGEVMVGDWSDTVGFFSVDSGSMWPDTMPMPAADATRKGYRRRSSTGSPHNVAGRP